MIIFWILAAGLVGLAILFAVLPLLRPAPANQSPDQDALNLQVFQHRLAELDGDLTSGFLEQAQYDAARHDLERELLYDLDGGPKIGGGAQKSRSGRAPWLATALALAVPVGAVLAYLQLGDSAIIARMETAGSAIGGGQTAAAAHDGQKVPPLDVLVQGLAERLEQDPDNLDGWLMLGRTYFAIKQPTKALAAMERAYQLAPKQANVVIAYAEALAANNGNRLTGKPAELIRTALEIEPGNASARWLDGMLAYQQERFADAAGTWQGILPEMDPAGQEAQQVRQLIAEARNRGGMPAAPPAIAQAPSAGAAPAQPAAARHTGAKIQVAVTLDPTLAEKADPDDTVFVFARASAGPPMPLAVQRLKVADLPATVTLDDSMAVMPAMRLSAFPQVVVGARVSKSGQATPQSGDLEGQIGPLSSDGTSDAAVNIDQVRR